MRAFTVADFQRDAGAVQDAAVREPVAIIGGSGLRFVLCDFEEFERLKARRKQVIAIQEMPDAFREALEQPCHDAEQAALDHLLD